jgi:hypothetical protein
MRLKWQEWCFALRREQTRRECLHLILAGLRGPLGLGLGVAHGLCKHFAELVLGQGLRAGVGLLQICH